MKLKRYSSACVSISSSNTNLIFDPWLISTAFLGSWQQWPPPEQALENALETKFDYIVYTHFHSDHWDPIFLKKYLEIWSKRGHKPRILLPKTHWIQLHKSVSDIARDHADVILIDSANAIALNDKGFELTFWVSDFCDPKSCGKLIPCPPQNEFQRALDSVTLIKDADFSIMNLNDAVSTNIDLHLQKLGITANLVMGVFGAAGSFPQCMSNYSQDAKDFEKKRFINSALDRLVVAAERLQASYIFPFAGEYVLSGSLANLNSNRAIEPVSSAASSLRNKTDKEIITLATNEECVFEKGELRSVGHPYIEPSSEVLHSYLVAKNAPYPYQLRPVDKVDVNEVYKNLELASLRISEKYRRMKKTSYTIKIETLNQEVSWQLNFGESLEFGRDSAILDNFSKVAIDLRLLDGCIRRTRDYKGFTSMHWNQAHIGSHLSFNQNTYDSTGHYLLNFLHK